MANEHINVSDSIVDKDNSGTDADELIKSIFEDGKINKDDKIRIAQLQEFFKGGKQKQLSKTKDALGSIFKDTLELGYTVDDDEDTLTFMLESMGLKYDFSKIPLQLRASDKKSYVAKLEGDKLYLYELDSTDNYGTDKVGYLKANNGDFVVETSNILGTDDDNPDDNGTISQYKTVLDAITTDLLAVQNQKITALEGKNSTLTAQLTALTKSSKETTDFANGLKSQLKAANDEVTDFLGVNSTDIDKFDANLQAAISKGKAMEQQITTLQKVQQNESALRKKIQEIATKLTLPNTDTNTHGETLKTLQGMLDKMDQLKGTSEGLKSDFEAYKTRVQEVFTRISEEQINAMEMSEDTNIETLSTFFTQLKQIGANQTELNIDASDVFTEVSTKNKTLLENAIRTEVGDLETEYNGTEVNFDSMEEATQELERVEKLIGILTLTKDEIGFPDSVLQSIKGKIQEYIEGNTEDTQFALRVEIAALKGQYPTNENFSDIEEARSLQSKVAELRTKAQTVDFPETVLDDLHTRAQEYINGAIEQEIRDEQIDLAQKIQAKDITKAEAQQVVNGLREKAQSIGFSEDAVDLLQGKINAMDDEADVDDDSEEMKSILREAIAKLNNQYSTNENFSDIEEARSLQSIIGDLRDEAQTVDFPETVLDDLHTRAQEYIDAIEGKVDTTDNLKEELGAELAQLSQKIDKKTITKEAAQEEFDTISQKIEDTTFEELKEKLDSVQEQIDAMDDDPTPDPEKPKKPTTDIEFNGAKIQPHNSLSQTSVEAYLGGAEAPTKEMIVTTLQSYVDTFPVWKSAEQKTFWQSDAGYQAAFALQAALAHLGMNPGMIDGVWGPKSGSALSQLGQGKNPGPKSIAKVLEELEK